MEGEESLERDATDGDSGGDKPDKPAKDELVVVVVVGAGASGLSAARTIHTATTSKPVKLVLLEARERIGGRVFEATLAQNLLQSNTSDAVVKVQLGANWIHGLISNPMLGFAKKLGLTLHPTSSDEEPGDDVLLFDCLEQNSDVFFSKKEQHSTTGSAEGVCLPVSNKVYKDACRIWASILIWLDEFDPVEGIRSLPLQTAVEIAIKESSEAITSEVRRCLHW